MSFRTQPCRATLRAVAVALLAAAAAGCAGTQKPEDIFWPYPPNKPRLKYVRTINGADGFDDRFMVKLRRMVAGATDENIVFNPNGVALSADETKLYVTSALGYVLRFDRVGHAVERVANAEGYKPVKPFGLAVDAAENLYVTDLVGAVYVYSPQDKFLRRIGEGIVERPTGIAIDRRRQLVYVVDGGTQKSQHHQIEVFAPDGRHLRSIGARGTEPGQFLFPGFATVSATGDLYVSDTMNGRVQVFDPDGNLVGIIGSLGDALGQFAKPKGIAFDGMGNLHVVDGQLATVQIFNSKNQLLMPYGGQSPRIEFMLLPNGIAITSKNEIFVADYVGNRVNEYLLFDTSAPEPEPAPARAEATSGASQPAPPAASQTAPSGAPAAIQGRSDAPAAAPAPAAGQAPVPGGR